MSTAKHNAEAAKHHKVLSADLLVSSMTVAIDERNGNKVGLRFDFEWNDPDDNDAPEFAAILWDLEGNREQFRRVIEAWDRVAAAVTSTSTTEQNQRILKSLGREYHEC